MESPTAMTWTNGPTYATCSNSSPVAPRTSMTYSPTTGGRVTPTRSVHSAPKNGNVVPRSAALRGRSVGNRTRPLPQFSRLTRTPEPSSARCTSIPPPECASTGAGCGQIGRLLGSANRLRRVGFTHFCVKCSFRNEVSASRPEASRDLGQTKFQP